MPLRNRTTFGAVLVAVLGGLLLAATLAPTTSPASGPVGSPTPTTPIASATPVATVTGNAFYISPVGSDANRGTIGSPWLTFAHAASALRPGDTLYARGGTYHGQTDTWPSSGTAARPIIFKAYQDEHPIFDGDNSQSQFLFFRGSVGFVTVQGLTIEGYVPVDSGIVDILESAHNIALRNLTMTGNVGPTKRDHLIYLAAPAVHDITISGNDLQGIGGGAIHLYHDPNARHVTIDHNVIRDCYWGVIVTSGADDVTIDHNTFMGNAIAVEIGTATNIRITNNLSYSATRSDELGFGLWVDMPSPGSHLTEDYNLWYTQGGLPVRANDRSYHVVGWRAATANSGHSIEADPLITGSGLLLPNSPAIGTALNGGNIGAN